MFIAPHDQILDQISKSNHNLVEHGLKSKYAVITRHCQSIAVCKVLVMFNDITFSIKPCKIES